MANPTTQRRDPLPVFCFRVELKIPDHDPAVAFFKSVSGLKYEAEVVDYRQGGVNVSTSRLVGAVKWPNLVLKRGFSKSYELLAWRESWLNDSKSAKLKRASGSIIQLSSDLKDVCRWKFTRAWPCKWEGPEYDGSKSELAIETLEIAHEGLEFEAK